MSNTLEPNEWKDFGSQYPEVSEDRFNRQFKNIVRYDHGDFGSMHCSYTFEELVEKLNDPHWEPRIALSPRAVRQVVFRVLQNEKRKASF